MKAVKIDKHSWHYWFADRWGGWEPYLDKGTWDYNEAGKMVRVNQIENDFCAYTRCVAFGLFNLTARIAGITLFAAAEVYGLVSLIRGLNGHKLDTTDQKFLTLFLVSVLVCAFALVLLGYQHWLSKRVKALIKNAEKNRRAKLPKPDGFIVTAYRSFKGRVCYLVTVIDKDKV